MTKTKSLQTWKDIKGEKISEWAKEAIRKGILNPTECYWQWDYGKNYWFPVHRKEIWVDCKAMKTLKEIRSKETGSVKKMIETLITETWG